MALTRSDTANGTTNLITTGFRSILIPVNTAQPELPCDMLDVAAYLATERRSSIVLLAFTEIPLWEEMDVELPGLDGHVEAMAKRARAIEAQRRKAQLIVLGATGRSRTSHRALAHDVVTRRISDQARVPTMFIQAPVAA